MEELSVCIEDDGGTSEDVGAFELVDDSVERLSVCVEDKTATSEDVWVLALSGDCVEELSVCIEVYSVAKRLFSVGDSDVECIVCCVVSACIVEEYVTEVEIKDVAGLSSV